MNKMIYEIISKKKCLLGESPIWHQYSNNFIWLDYLNGNIYFYNQDKNTVVKKIWTWLFHLAVLYFITT